MHQVDRCADDVNMNAADHKADADHQGRIPIAEMMQVKQTEYKADTE